MFLVGLTGGIASGKSTVAKMFKNEFGCQCIDADLIARQVVAPGQHACSQIRKQFGDDVFHADGQLDRDKVGNIIFHNEDKRRQLNGIVHPAIKKQMLWQIFLCFIKGHKFVILDIPLLFETKHLLKYIAYTVVVSCHEDQQMHRLMERNHLSADDAKARINAQLSLTEKCKLGTYVIDNSGGIEETREQCNNIHLKLQASSKHLPYRFGLLILFATVVGGILLFL